MHYKVPVCTVVFSKYPAALVLSVDMDWLG